MIVNLLTGSLGSVESFLGFTYIGVRAVRGRGVVAPAQRQNTPAAQAAGD